LNDDKKKVHASNSFFSFFAFTLTFTLTDSTLQCLSCHNYIVPNSFQPRRKPPNPDEYQMYVFSVMSGNINGTATLSATTQSRFQE
jgi:hypothetical protein